MKKFTLIAAVIAAAQIAGGPAFAGSSNDLDIDKAKESSSILKVEKEDFQTRIVTDSNLPSGIEVVIQEGSAGEKTFFKTSESFIGKDGNSISVPIFYEEVTKLPTEKVIRKGANTLVIDGISDKTKNSEKVKADEKIAAEAQQKVNEPASKIAKENPQSSPSSPSVSRNSVTESSPTPAPASAPSSNGVTSPEENKAYARSILSAADFACTDQLAMRESGWKTTATNPSSGAYGVAQSLPASKMASAGADWRTNGKTQVNWMISYMNERYGSPCNALAHSHAVGWY